MTRYDLQTRLFAISLSALAGYVDAAGFLGTGGSFMSFMSGNSTRLGVSAVTSGDMAVSAGLLILAFVAGVMVAALFLRRFHAHRSRFLLSLVAAGLALAAMLAQAPTPPLLAFLPAAFAMGAMNMMFELDGEVRFGLTYMTGTLVKFAHGLALAITGEDRWRWLSYLALWSGLAGGAMAGATAYRFLGVSSLWPCAVAALVLALGVPRVAADQK